LRFHRLINRADVPCRLLRRQARLHSQSLDQEPRTQARAKKALVPRRPEVAHRMRGTHQRRQATTWPRPAAANFRNNRPNGTDHPETDGTSFTFLGFTHIWGKSRAGKNVVRQVTAKNARALAAVTAWCRVNRHQPIPDQSAHLRAMMRGHYGISGNFRRLSWYASVGRQVWETWQRKSRYEKFICSRSARSPENPCILTYRHISIPCR
jgi:hypothetical protein